MEGREKAVGSAIEALWSRLEGIRNDANWEEKLRAASYLHHRDDYEGTQVEKRTTYDSSAEEYLTTFHDGFVGYLMPQDDTWLSLIPESAVYSSESRAKRREYADIEALDGVDGLLQYSEKLVSAGLSEYADSNYYEMASMALWDWMIFGTLFAMAVDDPREQSTSYLAFDPQEVCVAENHRGKVDVFVRKFRMDARDIVRAYPEARLKNIRGIVEAGGGERTAIEMYEAILPEGYLWIKGENVIVGDGRPFAHVIWCPLASEIVSESGYDEFPVAVASYERTNSVTPYGRSLAEKNLGDIIDLDDMGRSRMVQRQKNENPPMAVPYSLQGQYSSRPGARNMVPDVNQRPVPIYEGFDYSKLVNDIEEKKASLRASLKADLFRTVMGSTDSRKTAYEVSERKNEAMTLLMVSIGSLKKEFIDPIFFRTLKIMNEQGRAPSIDKAYSTMRNITAKRRDFASFLGACRIELSSVFVQRVSAYLQYSGLMAGLNVITAASQVFPTMRFQIDEAKYARYLLYGTSVPKAVIRSKKEAERAAAEYARLQMLQLQSQYNVQNSQAVKNVADAEGIRAGVTA